MGKLRLLFYNFCLDLDYLSRRFNDLSGAAKEIVLVVIN
jgi:hypothetical protein